MTDVETHSDHSPDEKKNGNRRLELSGTQIAASALAAISSAVAASYLGVTGTVLGAGFGSVVATISTALYQVSLKRTNETLKKVVPVSTVVVRQAGGRQPPADPTDLPDLGAVASVTRRAGDGPNRGATSGGDLNGGDPNGGDDELNRGATRGDEPNRGPTRGDAATAPSVDDDVTDDRAPADAADPDGGTAAARRLSWRRVAVAAAVVFVVTLGSITALELVLGGSLSSVVHGDDRNGTTIGKVVTRHADTTAPEDEPATSPTPRPSVTETPSPTAPDAETSAPASQAPSDSTPATPAPTTPTAPESTAGVAPTEAPASPGAYAPDGS